MAPLTTYGGNLIATLDFFRIGAKYYKVTEKVDVAGLQTRDIAALDFPAQLVLLKTVAHSLKILHDLRIVHSDLKPSNVLVKRTELGYTTKLIDFDSSYIAGNPPPPEEIVGTMNYYSPELVRYIQGSAAPGELTEASDIFALGLIYAEYLTGAMPPFDPAHHEPAIAVLHGQPLKLGPSRAPTLDHRPRRADAVARPGGTTERGPGAFDADEPAGRCRPVDGRACAGSDPPPRRAARQRNDRCDHQLTYPRTAPRARRHSLGTARQGGADRREDHRNRCAGPDRFGALRAVSTARLSAAPPDDL